MFDVSGRVRTKSGRPLKGIPVSNGEDVMLADARGRFTLSVDPEFHPLIFATRPDGYADEGWYVRTPAEEGEVELVLQPPKRRRSPSRTISIGQIADLHFSAARSGKGSGRVLLCDLREIHARTPELELLVANGDLTNSGALRLLRPLRRVLAQSPIPVIPMFGGHDGNDERLGGKTPLPYTRNWQQVLGPAYFSFELGSWHFTSYVDEDYFLGPERARIQHRWLEADLTAAAGKRIIFAQHSPPVGYWHTVPVRDWLKFLSSFGVEVLLFGHLHCSKVFRHAGVLVAGAQTLSMGGGDSLPRGYRTVELGPDEPSTRLVAITRTRARKHSSSARLKILWQSDASTRLSRGEPLVRNSDVFIPLSDEDCSGRGGVLCLDAATGERKWLAPAADSVRGALAVADQMVFAVTQPGGVLALDMASGRTVWSRWLDGFPYRWIYNGPVVVDCTVVAGTGFALQAFDARTGSHRWRWTHHQDGCGWFHYATPFSDAGSLHFTPPVIGHDVAVMVYRAGVSCLRASTGRVRWHYEVRHKVICPPMITVGKNVLIPEGTQFHAVDARSGKPVWSEQTGCGSVIAWGADDRLLVLNTMAQPAGPESTARNGTAQGRCAQTGRLLWECQYGRDLADVLKGQRGTGNGHSAPLLTEREVYIFGLDGRVQALDRDTGKQHAVLDLAEPIMGAALIDERRLALTTYPGSIVSVEFR